MVHREMLIGGVFYGGPCDQSIGKTVSYSPYTGHVVGTAAEAGWAEANSAIDAAEKAFEVWQKSEIKDRQELLRRISWMVRERSEDLALLMTDEIGKPITWSRGEVERLAVTFELAADACAKHHRESESLDYDKRGAGYEASYERFPIGPIFGIVPYNWPYNLAAHKLAPAIATGNTIIIKPSPQSAVSTLTLIQLIHEAGCPKGVVNCVPCEPLVAERIALDPRVKIVSFTGSPSVGWHLKQICWDKRVTLELGGDASAIVCDDADLDWTVGRLAAGAYGYAGQVCIKVQHALIERKIYNEVRQRMVVATNDCPTGDPRDERTICGPLISSSAADRVQSWVEEAVLGGAKVLAGGKREGNVLWPTLVEGVPPSSKLGCEEVFGPVLTIRPFDTFEEAISMVNASQYGIHCGVFTHREDRIEAAFQELEVGGVVINDYPTLRFDGLPYGGVKRSGFGREGVLWAMDEFTEPKSLVRKR